MSFAANLSAKYTTVPQTRKTKTEYWFNSELQHDNVSPYTKIQDKLRLIRFQNKVTYDNLRGKAIQSFYLKDGMDKRHEFKIKQNDTIVALFPCHNGEIYTYAQGIDNPGDYLRTAASKYNKYKYTWCEATFTNHSDHVRAKFEFFQDSNVSVHYKTWDAIQRLLNGDINIDNMATSEKKFNKRDSIFSNGNSNPSAVYGLKADNVKYICNINGDSTVESKSNFEIRDSSHVYNTISAAISDNYKCNYGKFMNNNIHNNIQNIKAPSIITSSINTGDTVLMYDKSDQQNMHVYYPRHHKQHIQFDDQETNSRLKIVNLSNFDAIDIWIENEYNSENRSILLLNKLCGTEDNLSLSDREKMLYFVNIKPNHSHTFDKQWHVCFITLINKTKQEIIYDREKMYENRLYFANNTLNSLLNMQPRCQKNHRMNKLPLSEIYNEKNSQFKCGICGNNIQRVNKEFIYYCLHCNIESCIKCCENNISVRVDQKT